MKQPTGTKTFLFTDIEGSTRLWEEQPDNMRVALARHDALLREMIEQRGGHIFKTMGDAFCAAFTTSSDAVLAALASQQALNNEPWPDQTCIRARMALHSGAAEARQGDYFGPSLNRIARLLAIGHGGQILLSDLTSDQCRNSLPADATLLPLGNHRLKDLERPMAVFQLCHPGLPVEFPPLRSLGNPELKHNLPHQMTSFIGREQELEKVRQLLGKSRLVTLTGAGGIGKTRLAMQTAVNIIDESKDGVWLVELAGLNDPEMVVQTVANALSLREAPGKSRLQVLTEFTKSKHLLLILDNCEHLLDRCAELVNAILRSSPGVLILATSREVLGISGEAVYRVPSLSLQRPARVASPEALIQLESARLFIDRASQAQPHFQVTQQNARTVASICYRLDGIPLAVELAAARVRNLSVEEVDQNLDQRFRLLTGGSRTALPRQQTLRALIDWSYDLLNEQEKALLCRLSVFSGGWTLQATEQVCSGGGIDDLDVLDLLTSLSDKSIVVTEERGSAMRYRLLETMRQYARDRLLEQGEIAPWRDRHLECFTDLGLEAEPHLAGGDQQDWLERLEAEYDNVRAALQWAEACDPEKGMRLAGAIWRFWYVRGHFSEGRERLSALLQTAGSHEQTEARASALTGLGVLAYCQGDYPAATANFEEGIAIRRALGDRLGVAALLNNLGNVAYDQANYAVARTLFEESLTYRRELGEKRGTAATLNNLGNVANEQGDYAFARQLFEESLALKEQLGDRWGMAHSLSNLGLVAYNQADYPAAHTLFEDSLALRRDIGDRAGAAISLNNLGNVAIVNGDVAAARAMFRESLIIERELGDRWGIAFSLTGLARAAGLERPALAAQLWGAAENLREEISTPIPLNERAEYEAQVASVRSALGAAAFDTAWAEGRAMTYEQASELALREEDD